MGILQIFAIFGKSTRERCLFIVPRFRESVGTLNLIRPSVCLSVCLSVCHKIFNLGHNFCTITDRALILGMCVPCDKTFPEVPCRDLDGDLWPTSRSNLLPSGGPQFSEFACFLPFDNCISGILYLKFEEKIYLSKNIIAKKVFLLLWHDTMVKKFHVL